MSGFLLAPAPAIDPGPARAAFEDLVQQYEKRVNYLENLVAKLGGITKRPTYTVVKGDTLTSIGRKFNTTYRMLEKWNGLTSASIVPGQVLFVAAP